MQVMQLTRHDISLGVVAVLSHVDGAESVVRANGA